MSKIKIYLLILAVAIVAVALGYMMHNLNDYNPVEILSQKQR